MKPFTTKQRWTAITVFGFLAALVTLTVISGPFNYSSICIRCGALRHASDWRLPLMEIPVFSRSTTVESPLSVVLLRNGIVSPHKHQWLFASGAGHGVMCAIGPGRHILPAANSKDFAGLFLTLHTHGQTNFRDRLLRGVFDPKTSDHYYRLCFIYPKEPTDDELKTWVAEESEYLGETPLISKEDKR